MLSALLWSDGVEAATVALPPGEPIAPWAPALEVAGLHLAAPREAELVLSAAGDRWEVSSRAALRVTVRAPRTPEERADLALLLSSLVQPAESLGWEVVGPAKPPKPPPPPPPRPRASAKTPAAPSPDLVKVGKVSRLGIFDQERIAPGEPVSDLASGAGAPILSLAPLSLPEAPPLPSERPPRYLWLEAGVQGCARAGLDPTGGSSLSLGLGRGPWRAGLRVLDEGEVALETLGEDRHVRGASGQAGLWFLPVEPLGLGLGAALSRRVYAQGEEDLQVERLPALWGEARAEPALGPGLRLAVGLRAARELSVTELWVGADLEEKLAPWVFSGSVGLLGRVGAPADASER